MNTAVDVKDKKTLSLGAALLIFLKGGLVGIANIIPGVSGGTFALILGIFDRLVGALNALGPQTVKVLWRLVAGGFKKDRRDDFLAEMKRIDLLFLAILMIGAVIVIFASSFLIKYLLAHHWSPTLAFFVGLILPSIIVPWAMMDKKGIRLLWVIPGIALTVGVSMGMPSEAAGSDNPLFALATGAIAISAMILPGISGSFIMLVMGQYQNVLVKVTGLQTGLAAGTIDFDAVIWLGALAVGMVVGILLFARLLNLLLVKAKSATMAFLIGLLLGSLWVLWPFKDVSQGSAVKGRDGEVKQEVQIATAPNRAPDNLTEGLIAFGAFSGGLVGSIGLIALGRKKEDDQDTAEAKPKKEVSKDKKAS